MTAKFIKGDVILFNKIHYYIIDVIDNGIGGKEYEVIDFSYEPPRSGLLSAETVDKEAVIVPRPTQGGKRKRTRRRTSRNKKTYKRSKSFKKRY